MDRVPHAMAMNEKMKLYIDKKITSLRGELIEMFEDDFNKAINDMESDFNRKVERLDKKLETKTDYLDIKEKIIDLDKVIFELDERVSKLFCKDE